MFKAMFITFCLVLKYRSSIGLCFLFHLLIYLFLYNFQSARVALIEPGVLIHLYIDLFLFPFDIVCYFWIKVHGKDFGSNFTAVVMATSFFHSIGT